MTNSSAYFPHRWQRRLAGITLLLVASSVHAALEVRSLAFEGKLPYVESKSAAELRTASRINHAIFLELLGLAAPARLQDGLKAIQREEGSAAVSDIRFTVDRSDARVLALSVAAQGCGAYCEPFTLAFVFDALSGRRVQANDLFSPQGARSVAQLLARQRVTRIKNEVARLRNLANPESKAGKKLSDGERESHLEAAGMFEACIPQYADAAQGQNPMQLEAMQLTGTSVVFTRGRCSIHAMQALDDLGEFKNPLQIQDLSPHLSPYGRYLVAAGPAAPPPASPFGQVLFGKIGNAAVTVWLRVPTGPQQELGGLYFYDRFRKPLSIFGSRNDDAWELAEEAPEGKPVPILRFKVNADALTGEWITPQRRLPFEAAP